MKIVVVRVDIKVWVSRYERYERVEVDVNGDFLRIVDRLLYTLRLPTNHQSHPYFVSDVKG